MFNLAIDQQYVELYFYFLQINDIIILNLYAYPLSVIFRKIIKSSFQLCKSIAKQDHEQNLQNAEIHNSTIHQKLCKTQNIPSFPIRRLQ